MNNAPDLPLPPRHGGGGVGGAGGGAAGGVRGPANLPLHPAVRPCLHLRVCRGDLTRPDLTFLLLL